MNYINEFGVLTHLLDTLGYVHGYYINDWINPTAVGIMSHLDISQKLNDDLQGVGYVCNNVVESDGIYLHTVKAKIGLLEVSQKFNDSIKGGIYLVCPDLLDNDLPYTPLQYNRHLTLAVKKPGYLPTGWKVYKVAKPFDNIRVFQHSDSPDEYWVYDKISKDVFQELS